MLRELLKLKIKNKYRKSYGTHIYMLITAGFKIAVCFDNSILQFDSIARKIVQHVI